MQTLILSAWIFQGLLMFFDEFIFHHKRGLKAWERIGHPIDSFFFFVPFIYTQFFHNEYVFLFLCVLSSILVTKDEFVHADECDAPEQWLHAFLFLIHPVSLFCLWFAWKNQLNLIIQIQAGIIFLFTVYQIVYWIFLKGKRHEAQN